MKGEKTDRILKELRSNKDRSARGIAKAAGCTHSQVNKVLKKHPELWSEKRLGEDGRTRRATRIGKYQLEAPAEERLSAHELEKIAEEINSKLKQIDELRKAAFEAWNAYAIEASLVGWGLRRMLNFVAEGKRPGFIETYLPALKLAHAKEYMDISINPQYKET